MEFLLSLLLIGTAHAAPGYACPEYYAPVCGYRAGAYETYSNTCFLSGEGATHVHEGECTREELARDSEPPADGGQYVPPPGCTAWFDGCNSCSRETPNGPAMCTLMACSGKPAPGYCRSYEVPKPVVDGDTPVTDGGTVSSPPAGVGGGTPAPVDDVTPEPEESQEQVGFASRLWTSIVTWFSNLF